MAQSFVAPDSTTLIALTQLEHLLLLKAVFGDVAIVPAVAREVQTSVALPHWAIPTELPGPLDRRVIDAKLGAGESEVIGLALTDTRWIALLDDDAARSTARALGVRITGTLGVLVAAKRLGLIPAVRPLMDQLIQQFNFFVGRTLYAVTLEQAGELVT